MMVTKHPWTPLSDTQARVFVDARAQFDLYLAAQRRVAEFPGWMFWKKYPNGRTYLVHAYDRAGNGTTLGAENRENEAKLLRFKTEQADAKLRFKMAKDKVAEQARFCKAARINRVPRLIAAIVRAFREQAATFQSFVIDASALYVYEALFGVQFSASALDPAGLTLVFYCPDLVPPNPEKSELDNTFAPTKILRSIDDSFAGSGEIICNTAGFTVKLLGPIESGPRSRLSAIKQGTSIQLMGIDPIATLAEVVIDQDGMPLEMRAPDPRLFAAGKRWLSEQETRFPVDRERDRLQSEAVVAAMRSRSVALRPLPQLPDNPDSERFTSILRDLDLAGN